MGEKLRRVMEAIWYPSAWECAQLSHFALGLAAVWGAVAVLHGDPLKGAAWLLLFALAKEGIFDIVIESDGYLGGAWDFLFYFLGTVLALSALWLR